MTPSASRNYTIRPQDDLATGTEINAVADIVFDTNEPIVTPEVVNTIEVTDPTSAVEALPVKGCRKKYIKSNYQKLKVLHSKTFKV